MGPIAFGASTAIGSGLGALAAGAKGKDALKAAALSGITAGGMRGFTNYMDPNIDSVWGSTYKGAGDKLAAGKIGDLQTSFGNIDTSTPMTQNLGNQTGADFGQYGKVDSLIDSYSPEYYGASSNINPNLGIDPTIQMDPSLLETNLPATSSYTGNAPNMTGGKYQPYNYAAQDARTIKLASNVPSSAPVSDPAYNTLYGPSTTGQATSGVGDVANRLSPGAGDQSYTVGGDYNYTAKTLKEQAMDALTDNRLARGIDQATDYAGQLPMGSGNTLGDVTGAIAKDYGTTGGLLRAGAIAASTPDYLAGYEAEDERKRQLEELEKLGYKIELSDAETGFNQTVVIRDPSGKVLPQNLSLQDLLDRIYGRTPRTRLTDKITYGPRPTTAKHGGLINLAHGGEFSGMVEGDGHGMEDNVYMPIKEQGNQVGTLAVSPSEYVVDAYTMSALGNGNADAGAKVMDGVVESVRKKAYGTVRQPNEISGLQALKPMMMGV